MRKASLSLRLSLVLYVIIPLVVAVGLLSYVALRAYESHIEERMEDEVELVARTLQLPLGRALERDRPGTVDRALESAFSIHRVYGAYVYDTEGSVIAAIGSRGDPPSRGRLSEIAELGSQRGEYDDSGRQTVYSYYVPLIDTGGRNNGLLQVTRRASDIEETIATLRWRGSMILLAALLLLTGLVLIGHHGAVGRHLSRLGRSMQRVEQGEREHRAPEEGPVEIARLGHSLNTMLDSLAQARRELHKRREAQADLEAQLRHAEKLAAIGELSAGVAHELGTPLSVIDGKAQRVLRHDGMSDRMEGALEDIRAEVRRMEHIVRQLLAFGRRPRLQRRELTAAQLVRMAVGNLAQEQEHTDTDIEIEGPEPSPHLSVDPVLMDRVLVNLLKNAIEANPGGTVRVSWEELADEVCLTVEDDGPGIAEEARSRLFEPFYTTKQVGKGTGLGLAVVHGTVEEHDGRIEVDDSPLGGARFRVYLPLSTAEKETSDLAT